MLPGSAICCSLAAMMTAVVVKVVAFDDDVGKVDMRADPTKC
jgi:hypothetical protein